MHELNYIKRELKTNSRRISIILIGFLIVGVLTALFKPYYFMSETKFITFLGSSTPNISNRALLKISKLAGLAGSLEENTFDPALMPSIIYNREMIIHLANKRVKPFEDEDSLNFMDYFLLHESGEELKFNDILMYDSANSIIISKDFEKLEKNFFKRIGYDLDFETNIFSISTKFKSSVVSQQICAFILQYLEDYVIDYKLGRYKEELVYLQQRDSIMQYKYDRSGENIAQFLTDYQNLLDENLKFELEKLNIEHQMNYSILSEIKSQLEMKLLDIEEKKPSLYIVEKPAIHLESSSLSGLTTIALFFLLGVCVCFTYVFFNDIVRFITNQS